MAERGDGFRSAGSAARFFLAYDEAVRRWPLPSEELDVDTSFGRTRVRRCGTGDGEPILLLHGALGTSLSWAPLVAVLGAEHLLYLVDSLGEPGRSVPSRTIPDGQASGQWLTEAMDGLGVDRAHVAGTSRGGWLAMHLALREPRRVASLTLVDSAGFGKLDVGFYAWSFGLLVSGLLPAGVRGRLGPWRGVHRTVLDLAPELIRAGLRHRLRVVEPIPLAESELRAIAMPTNVLIAERSALFPLREATRGAALIPNVRVEVIPGATHNLPFADPELVAERILLNINDSTDP